ncbi:hypothetical protein RhiirA1_476233 [Rhizophagus irregularis]|uniref:Uncharacterized protein n=1 Tax=Rhizophagus irregularis TaxID=588596 RepID=A0A2N0QVG6_9GLOM|nr:hypothetical protein RhiirA1_476233 [Rhizophagus irregularis]
MEDFSSPSSPNNNDNNMIIDDKNEMEHPISSEPDVSSRDTSTSISQTPIINSQDAMDTDLPENDSDKGITQGSADTQITSDTNNDPTLPAAPLIVIKNLSPIGISPIAIYHLESNSILDRLHIKKLRLHSTNRMQ